MADPFVVEENFSITGRGTVVTGKSDGLIVTGDTYALRNGTEFKIRGIERFVNMLGQPPKKGEQIGLLLGAVDRDLFPPGTELFRMFGKSTLESPRQVIHYLERAVDALTEAHHAAGERESDRTDLVGPTRDAIYGLNSAVSALISLIEESEC